MPTSAHMILLQVVKYGCAEKVAYYKEGHKRARPSASYFCPESDRGFAGPTKVLLDHFTTNHKCRSTAHMFSVASTSSIEDALKARA